LELGTPQAMNEHLSAKSQVERSECCRLPLLVYEQLTDQTLHLVTTTINCRSQMVTWQLARSTNMKLQGGPHIVSTIRPHIFSLTTFNVTITCLYQVVRAVTVPTISLSGSDTPSFGIRSSAL